MTAEKKLYRVTAEYEYFIVADDDTDAWQTARDKARDAFSDIWDPDIFVSQVMKLEQVPKDWRESMPYGEDVSDRTCAQILASALDVAAEHYLPCDCRTPNEMQACPKKCEKLRPKQVPR